MEVWHLPGSISPPPAAPACKNDGEIAESVSSGYRLLPVEPE